MTNQLTDAIDQATWMAEQSSYEDVEDLWRSNPDLFTALAAEWREDHPLNHLGS